MLISPMSDVSSFVGGRHCAGAQHCIDGRHDYPFTEMEAAAAAMVLSLAWIAP